MLLVLSRRHRGLGLAQDSRGLVIVTADKAIKLVLAGHGLLVEVSGPCCSALEGLIGHDLLEHLLHFLETRHEFMCLHSQQPII